MHMARCANFSELSGKQHFQSVVYSLGINVKSSLSDLVFVKQESYDELSLSKT